MSPIRSLTFKAILVTGIAGIFTWTISDFIEGHSLADIFHSNLTERLSDKAREQRTRFNQYIKVHHDVVKLLASSQAVNSHIPHLSSNCKTIRHSTPPAWLPKPGLMRRLVKPRHAFLLNKKHKVCEYYSSNGLPPEALLAPSEMLILLSHDQSFITSFNSQPYLLTAEPIRDENGRDHGIFMTASPIDDQFLIKSQAPSTGNEIVALLSADSDVIAVSSHPDVAPIGATLESLNKDFIVTGLGFFDYGASDIIIRFASLLSTAEVNQLTDAVMSTAHTTRAISAIVFILVFSIIILWIVKRIESLTERVIDFSVTMDVDEPNKPISGDPIDILNDKFNSLTQKIIHETEALEYQALHDALTSLPNRKMLMNSVEREIARSKRYKKPFSLFMIDLDRFKDINDTLGHHMGDRILQQVAARLLETLRDSDLVARLGGDEFGILLPEATQANAKNTAEKIEKAFEKPFVLDEYNLTVGVSIGIAEYPEHGQDENVLLQRADVAMYNAKRDGGGYALYDAQHDEYSYDRLSLMTEMREALDNNKLKLFYQPIVDVESLELVCVESLLRWHREGLEEINPDQFIPLAEHTGMIQPLTDWVLAEAIAQCELWNEMEISIGVSINISVHNLHDATLPERVKQLLDKHNIKPEQLHIELTESAIMTDPVHAKMTLQGLYNMGIQVLIDDFGTGYSSLSYLKQLPVSHIKIDRSFVRNMNQDEDDAVIVRATIDLAHNLGLGVVAEGVENMETLELLSILGCDLAQGFRIGKPMPADEFVEWSRNYRSNIKVRHTT